jgi:hypothetical protein
MRDAVVWDHANAVRWLEMGRADAQKTFHDEIVVDRPLAR